MSLYYLLYVSRETDPLSVAELQRLAIAARGANLRYGITGLLLHRDRKFIQMLEGEFEAVWSLYTAIHRDPRHQDLVVALHGEIEHRNFPGSPMAFDDLGQELGGSGALAKDEVIFDRRMFAPHARIAVRFFEAFKESDASLLK